VGDIALHVLDLVLEVEGAERGYAMLLHDSSIGQTDFSSGYEFEPALIPLSSRHSGTRRGARSKI